ncbi:NADPH:quinone oxidoreductase [Jannaschia pagri]|uniref:NADPH:quinone oxidoreductase n=1 Tax=Jannaschia pagri TaxID=2829797 RepID=A0ABQ4NK74_9RHOB|nr:MULTISPECIES: NADPH:quinone oxidoreductase family protein [unclassified Jannaschia]GIT90772.1 NADPH:quinone oxidoreductase [Jannaschia sp. AI_61]GIT94604.1 NADPH:quinone oxidoreductase [Jannaschia sp. AI_62]
MKGWQVETRGDIPVFKDLTVPSPGPGQVQIQIEACGLNFADLLMVKGTYQDTPEAPFTPGLEVCGKVIAQGDGVSAPAIGQRVAVFGGQGGLAEIGCFPADRCVAVPDSMPSTVAAGFIVAYGTSHVALAHKARLQPGERLLVLGAAGGVGLTAVELGANMGAEVIAVARGPEKLQIAKDHGATHLIDAGAPDLREQVKALGGADVVYDAVGGDAFDAAFRATNPGGRIIVIGFASGTVPQIKANHLMVKNIDVMGVYWGGYLKFDPKVVTDSLAALFAMYGAGGLRPHVSHVLALDKADEALELLRSRRSTGKVVVAP